MFRPDTYLIGGITLLLVSVIWFFLTGIAIGYAPLQQAGQLICFIAGLTWIHEYRNPSSTALIEECSTCGTRGSETYMAAHLEDNPEHRR